MIEERRGAVTDFLTGRTGTVFNSHLLNLLPTMLAHEMENPICLCKSLIRATRTFERSGILLGMLRGNMDGQCLCVEKLFLTRGARVRQMPFMLFHMVVHRVLVLFDFRTDSTDKLTRSILLISVRHL